MAGGSVVSAIPEHLINYGVQATLLDGRISAQASVLGQALSAFINSNPDPKYIGSVPRLDQSVSNLASSARGTDAWVGRVGEAFKVVAQEQVASLEHHTGTTGLDPATWDTTSTQSTISSYAADMGAAFQADVRRYVAQQHYAQGQRDAQALVRVLNDPHGTEAQTEAIVQQLKSHLGDSSYLAGYFNRLGVRFTLGTLDQFLFNGMGPLTPLRSGNPLQTFDEAFAGATHSPLLSPSFLTGMFPNQTDTSHSYNAVGAYEQMLPLSTMLMRYGTYSKPFLAQALQTIVMPFAQTTSSVLVADGRLNPQVVQRNAIIFQALARNPAADAQILSSQYAFTDGGRTFHGASNVQILLGAYWRYQQASGDSSGGGLSAAISAITKDTATNDRMRVLQDIGNTNWTDIPDGVRTAIAGAIAHDLNNPAFTRDDQPVQTDHVPTPLTWQQRLFIAATTNNNGSANVSGLTTLRNALDRWLKHHPMPSGQAVNQNSSEFTNWAEDYGRLAGLVVLGSRAGGYQSAADAQKAFSTFNSLFGDLTTIFPPSKLVEVLGGKQVATTVFSLVYNHVDSAVTNRLAPTLTAAEQRDKQVYLSTLAHAQAYVVTRTILEDPGVLPADLRSVYHTDPADPRVQQFIAAVGAAGGTQDLTNPPQRSAPNPAWPYPAYHLTPQQLNSLANIIKSRDDLQTVEEPYFHINF